MILVQTLSEQVYKEIRERILSERLLPLKPIRQDALSSELGVSKIPLREALARLEQDGLISNYPNRGFVVQPLSIEEAEDVFRLRGKIEPDAAAASALIATAADQDAVRVAYQAVEEDAMSPTSRAVSLNRAFHLALVRPSGRNVTISLLDRLHVVSERYVRKHLEPPDREDRAHSEHKAIFAAWMDRDSRAVRSLLLSHTRGTMDDLRVELAT
jgi:DNA-binding GntR family transcriptional regulator